MRRNRTILTSIITSVLTFVILMVVGMGLIGVKIQNSGTPKEESAPAPSPQVPAPQQISTPLQNSSNIQVADIVKKSVLPVVGIAVLKPDGNSIFKKKNEDTWGLGTGIIVDSAGYILTNHHVAGGRNKRIIVTLSGGDSVDGTTLWSDSVIDLAVVKINVSGLPAAKLGDSGSLKVGEPAIAIGNPLGLQLQRTVTSGIVSALNRTVEIETEQGYNFMEDLIQTDASINPGNSGGPLINSKGEVVGINTIKVASAEAIGFAIPINLAKPIINSFVKKGIFNEPYLGLFAYDKEVMPYVDPGLNIDGGVYVARLDAGSPAARSGIKVGDVIKNADGVNVQTMVDLRTVIYNKNPDDSIPLTVVSNGVEKQVTVVLGKKIRDGLITR